MALTDTKPMSTANWSVTCTINFISIKPSEYGLLGSLMLFAFSWFCPLAGLLNDRLGGHEFSMYSAVLQVQPYIC